MKKAELEKAKAEQEVCMLRLFLLHLVLNIAFSIIFTGAYDLVLQPSHQN